MKTISGGLETCNNEGCESLVAWTDGTPFNYSAFFPYEFEANNRGRFFIMSHQQQKTHDVDCTLARSFICQFECQPPSKLMIIQILMLRYRRLQKFLHIKCRIEKKASLLKLLLFQLKGGIQVTFFGKMCTN